MSGLYGSGNNPGFNIFTDTLADMKWPDIKRAAGNNAIVLLPIGVIEQHGPHLCLATDIYTAHIYCAEVKALLEKKDYESVIAPPFFWGICQSSKGFAGSFNIRPETAKALLQDILTSLCGFGFKRIFGVNAHADVEHKIIAVRAFSEVCEQSGIIACFPYEDFMLDNLGLTGNESCFYITEPQILQTSKSEISDVHAGDVETATINAFYPHLADTKTAQALPGVPLGDNFEAWMFEGQLERLSPQGYLGSPSSFESVDINKHIKEHANRISNAIIARINRDKENRTVDNNE